MLRLNRPLPPPGFEAAVAPLRASVQSAMLQPVHPAGTAGVRGRRQGGKRVVEFPSAWTTYKQIFAEAQHGKCGYCEMDVIGGQPGDVDHFWPKGEVWALGDDSASWGRERPWLSTVDGRKRNVIAEQGYWWKAYDWSNYVLSCIVCNEYWKLSFFPVQEDPRTLPPTESVVEIPLLLDPFDQRCNPGDHLRFTDLGQVEPRNGSRLGFETIRTLGLDRESLRRLRHQEAQRAYRLARDLAVAPQDRELEVLSHFYDMGHPHRRFAGMIRIIFEDLCGVAWSALDARFAGP